MLSQPVNVLSETYSHLKDVELTDEELMEAVMEAKQKKYDRLELERKRQLRIEYEAEIRRPWTPEDIYNNIHYVHRRIYGAEMVVDESNQKVIKALCYYFTADERFEAMKDGEGSPYGWKLGKGIILCGNVGVGKSTLMRLFSRNKRSCYDVVSCRDVSALFAADGGTAITAYSNCRHEAYNNPDTYYQKKIGICFDDLGTEDIQAHFSNKLNAMANIILNRYDKKDAIPFWYTHITTNLTAEEIENMYGSRVRSRFREMFNVIQLNGKDRRI